MKLSFFALTALFIFFQGRTTTHKELTMDFVNWLKVDPKLTFVSNKSDTVKYEIDGHLVMSERDHRLTDYHKIAKDTSYYADFLVVDTFPHHPPTFTILFEGCRTEANGHKFNHTYNFGGKELHDVAEFEVKHDNIKVFKNTKKEVKKVWWSISMGLLKYETKDALLWKRLK